MRVLFLILLGALIGMIGLPAQAAPVLVYYSSVVPARERQEALRSAIRKIEGPASSLEFTVFGRFSDFSEQLDAGSSQVVVAPSFFSKFHPDYIPILVLKKGVSRQYHYLVVSLGSEWSERNLSKGRIGMVDEVGRDKLKTLLPEILKTRVDRIKSVSKSEDLYPLLAFKSVDFVLISAEDQQMLKEKFSMSVRKVLETKPVDRPMVFVRKESLNGSTIKSIRDLPNSVWDSIGFSGVELIAEGKQ